VTALEHEHYTCHQKLFRAMEPNLKLLIKDLMKQVRDEIVINFVTHSEAINKCISELVVADQVHDEWVMGLETTLAAFDKLFMAWKLEMDESLTSIKLKLAKLSSFFDRDTKQSPASKPRVLQIESATVRPHAGSSADGPNGHSVNNNHRDCGYGGGGVYTHIHDPIKGM
jgi:hypothetical protein